MGSIAVVEGFSEAFSGELLRSDHPDYEAVRQVHNGMIDKPPELIARWSAHRGRTGRGEPRSGVRC